MKSDINASWKNKNLLFVFSTPQKNGVLTYFLTFIVAGALLDDAS